MRKKSRKPRQVKLHQTRYMATKHGKNAQSKKKFKVIAVGKKFAVVRKGSAFY